MVVLLDQFVETLSQSGLMTRGEVQAFVDGLRADEQPESGEALAKLLVRHGRLTKFQAQCVYQGKARGLSMGDYVVLDRIGAGGMGQVYKARHKVMKRVVALKTLPPAAAKSDRAVKRFHREVEVAARLSHPNVVTAHDAREDHGVHFLVMEHVEGTDLGRLVKQQGQLPVRAALDYTLQAARGLEYAHNQNVIHRDIKPSNLVLDRQGTIKILDMGLARLEQEIGSLDSTAAASLTQSGQVMGTVDYMPPEQSMDTHGADARADVYSLGCTLYYLLTGRAVYGGDTLAKKIMAHREKAIPSLKVLRPDVPEELDVAFQKMLAKRPQDRHGKMSAVLADLEACRGAIEEGVEETITYQGEASQIDTSGTRHDATVDKPGDDSALDRWLHEELPAGPTHFVSQPRKRRQLTRQQVIIGSVAAAVCFLFLLLGVVFSIKTPAGTLSHPENGAFHAPYSSKAEIGAVEPLPAPDPGAWKAILAPDAPAPAIAPFDPATANKHQQAWADYLGVPIEQEVTLADDVKLKMVLIPPGEFVMGSSADERTRFLEEARAAKDMWAIERIPTEGPRHRVRITKPFRLGRHEVTVGQFRQFVDQTGYKTDAERDGQGGRGLVDGEWVQDPRFVWNTDPGFEQTDDHPVVNVSWNDAVAFCEWLSEKEEAEFVLPSEAQWEYACRAGTTTFWHCGDEEAMLQEYAWFGANSGDKTHPVGELLPNGFCLYDMHGNVWEWCADYWATDYYAESPSNDPSGPSAGSHRVGRGGGWGYRAGRCRSALRYYLSPDDRRNCLGFRPASVLVDK